jgi:hypothetical protein
MRGRGETAYLMDPLIQLASDPDSNNNNVVVEVQKNSFSRYNAPS